MAVFVKQLKKLDGKASSTLAPVALILTASTIEELKKENRLRDQSMSPLGPTLNRLFRSAVSA